MVDEVREDDEDRLGLLNRFGRDEVLGELYSVFNWTTSPLEESLLVDNALFLSPGDHPGADFTRDRLVVRGCPGARVVGKWRISCEFARIVGVHFQAGSGDKPLVEGFGGATVVFQDCTFEMSPALLSVGVKIDHSPASRAIFSGCAFLPDLNGGTGKPITHGGAAGRVLVIWGLNLTGRTHGTVTVVTTELT